MLKNFLFSIFFSFSFYWVKDVLIIIHSRAKDIFRYRVFRTAQIGALNRATTQNKTYIDNSDTFTEVLSCITNWK
jgi:hypothetical protein